MSQVTGASSESAKAPAVTATAATAGQARSGSSGEVRGARRVPWSVFAGLGGALALFRAWQVWGGVEDRDLINPAFLMMMYMALAVAAWRAARRCRGYRQVARAWRFIAVAFAFLAGGYGLTVAYQAITGAVPFPSAVDVSYLLYYPTFIVGLLQFPRHPQSRQGRVRLGLDAMIVGLGAASVIWYLVLGPTVTAPGQKLLPLPVAGGTRSETPSRSLGFSLS